ncbi:MAG TPA: histidine kinase, partial [Saprospiraceae bacterium]|nr:histidine kinase [Saprospiraceae bacterium]
NPHFLFNTLNNLYILARKKSDKTSGAIMMLSKILRFMLYDCRAHQIAVADEAKVIQDYIELEKLRYNDRLYVRYEENLEQPHALVAPLLLLPFVENSFKHGAHSTTGDAEIHIRLSVVDKKLSFMVENTVEGEDKTPASTGSSGIGLKNVQRQLDLIYPGRYRLHNGREDELYRVELELELD